MDAHTNYSVDFRIWQTNSCIKNVVFDIAKSRKRKRSIKEALEQRFRMPVDVIRYRALMNKYLKARIDREAVYV